ncbi:BA14K family protein [Brevundimonas sp. 2R-24]|uniref:Lectin-like protein BA14k n=1 Tax=Peiella sedimenti TaxID=3061083 RepID=A0ABT8SJM7_9CAUL|nr:BA14K family protein [Caulobacteraceae bacterium XZ-24]
MKNVLITCAATAGLALSAAAMAPAPAEAQTSYGRNWTAYCYRNEDRNRCWSRLSYQERYGHRPYDGTPDYRGDPYRGQYGYGSYGYNPYSYGGYNYGGYSSSYPYSSGRYYGRTDPYYGSGTSELGVLATILGQALGVDIRGSYDDRAYYDRYRNDAEWRRWCASRYRSFDPYSGTYQAHDGYRYYCRMY